MELDLAKVLPNLEAPKICKQLLYDLYDKKITMEEFEFELACYALESMDELKFKPLPAKPTVLWEFERQRQSKEWMLISSAERRELTTAVMSQDEVKKYFEEYLKKLWENVGNAMWLEKCMGIFLKKGDKVYAEKVWNVYNTYPKELGDYYNVWEKKKF